MEMIYTGVETSSWGTLKDDRVVWRQIVRGGLKHSEVFRYRRKIARIRIVLLYVVCEGKVTLKLPDAGIMVSSHGRSKDRFQIIKFTRYIANIVFVSTTKSLKYARTIPYIASTLTTQYKLSH